MLAKALFLIFLIIFSFLSFYIDLPPGTYVTDQITFSFPQSSFFTNNLLNGLVFGAIISAAVFLVRRRTKPSLSMKRTSTSKEIEKLLSDHVTKTESDLTEIKGIGPKRALDLEIAGVRTISDLAKRSPKHLAEKTGMPIKQISKWIIEANKLKK